MLMINYDCNMWKINKFKQGHLHQKTLIDNQYDSAEYLDWSLTRLKRGGEMNRRALRRHMKGFCQQVQHVSAD
jgi:hypothetical protein